MKKNNTKVNSKKMFNKGIKFSITLSNVLIFITFSTFLFLLIFFVWKRHWEVNEYKGPPLPQKVSRKTEVQQLVETTSLLTTDLVSLSDRLNALEAIALQQNALRLPDKVIALELLRGSLNGRIPLDPLRSFLQKRPESWKSTLLTALASVQEVKDYAQLEAMLVFPSVPTPLPVWEKIKNKIKSLIQIRKIDENGHYQTAYLQDIRAALQAHNIQNALEAFAKLSPELQAQFAFWKKQAENRLTLETQEKYMLLEIAGE